MPIGPMRVPTPILQEQIRRSVAASQPVRIAIPPEIVRVEAQDPGPPEGIPGWVIAGALVVLGIVLMNWGD